MENKTKTLTVACDPCWNLQAWKGFITRLILTHGLDAVLKTDAGYNNVDLKLVESVDPTTPEGGVLVDMFPSGLPIYAFERFVPFDRSAIFGDIFTLEEYIKMDFMYYDGVSGEILIDGKLTNLTLNDPRPFLNGKPVKGKEFAYVTVQTTLEELKQLEGKVEIAWYNK